MDIKQTVSPKTFRIGIIVNGLHIPFRFTDHRIHWDASQEAGPGFHAVEDLNDLALCIRRMINIL